MTKLALSVVAFVTALIAGVSWGRAPLVELTGMSPTAATLTLGALVSVLSLFVALAISSGRAAGRRGTAFTGTLVVVAALLGGGFAFATPTWQSELKTTVALAAPGLFDDGERTCRDNAEQLLVTFEDMTMENWRETNEVLTNRSAAQFGVAALAATHFGSVLLDVVVGAITDKKSDPRIYGDAHELAEKWGLKERVDNPRVMEDGRAFFDDVLDHMEAEHKEGLETLKKLKGELKTQQGKSAAEVAAELKAVKVEDRWELRNDEPDAKPLRCVREDGRWRLDMAK